MYETIMQAFFITAMCVAGGIAVAGLKEERDINRTIKMLERRNK